MGLWKVGIMKQRIRVKLFHDSDCSELFFVFKRFLLLLAFGPVTL